MKPVRYPDDCKTICKRAVDLGYDCTLKQAEELWEAYSDHVCASWLGIHEDTTLDVLDCAIREYFGSET